jgi:hypothetical protein
MLVEDLYCASNNNWDLVNSGASWVNRDSTSTDITSTLDPSTSSNPSNSENPIGDDGFYHTEPSHARNLNSNYIRVGHEVAVALAERSGIPGAPTILRAIDPEVITDLGRRTINSLPEGVILDVINAPLRERPDSPGTGMAEADTWDQNRWFATRNIESTTTVETENPDGSLTTVTTTISKPLSPSSPSAENMFSVIGCFLGNKFKSLKGFCVNICGQKNTKAFFSYFEFIKNKYNLQKQYLYLCVAGLPLTLNSHQSKDVYTSLVVIAELVKRHNNTLISVETGLKNSCLMLFLLIVANEINIYFTKLNKETNWFQKVSMFVKFGYYPWLVLKGIFLLNFITQITLCTYCVLLSSDDTSQLGLLHERVEIIEHHKIVLLCIFFILVVCYILLLYIVIVWWFNNNKSWLSEYAEQYARIRTKFDNFNFYSQKYTIRLTSLLILSLILIARYLVYTLTLQPI